MLHEDRLSDFETFTDPSGQTLSYLRRGRGPLLVCVPGGPGLDPEAYFAGVDLPGLEMLIFAPRGTALSTAPESADGYRIAGYIRDLESLRVHLALDRMMLYGNSYGGSVALAYASTHRDRVDRLIISNAAARVDQAFEDAVARATGRFVAHVQDAAGRLSAAAAADAAAETDSSNAARQRAHRASMACRVAHEGPVEAAYLDRLCAAPRNSDAVSGMWVEWRAGMDLFEGLAAVTAPTLPIGGQFDTVVPPDVVRQIAEAMANARYVEIPDVGHFVAIEARDRFQDIVCEFLR
jgi:pimeloyl-ACP methyl ester carboxylesterase